MCAGTRLAYMCLQAQSDVAPVCCDDALRKCSPDPYTYPNPRVGLDGLGVGQRPRVCERLPVLYTLVEPRVKRATVSLYQMWVSMYYGHG